VRLAPVQPPPGLDAEATGELQGTGRWTLTSADGGTLVRYYGTSAPPGWWMNVQTPGCPAGVQLEPRSADASEGTSLAGRFGAGLALPDTPSRPHQPVRAASWVALGAALVAVAVLGWAQAHLAMMSLDARAASAVRSTLAVVADRSWDQQAGARRCIQ